MGLYTEPRTEYTLAIDTDSYSGNFERELFAFIFGIPDTPDGGTRDLSLYANAAKEAGVSKRLRKDFQYELLDVRLNDPGDDGYHRAYVTICPTPGYFLAGEGVHYEDTEANRRKVGAKRHPAFQSVAIFLEQLPTNKELDYIRERAQAFQTFPSKHSWETRPKILGYRILVAKTTWEEREVGLL
jgi:hypothetical protein